MAITFINFLSRVNPGKLKYILFFCILLLGIIDYATGIEFSFSIFYILPIAAGSWYAGKKAGIFLSIESIILWFIADNLGGHNYSSEIFLTWNIIMRFCLFLIISLILSTLNKNMTEKAEKEAIIKITQKITLETVTHINDNNSRILNWISLKQANGHQVSDVIKSASANISMYLLVLSEMSYVYPYVHERNFSAQEFINSFHERIQNVEARCKET